MWGGGPSFCIGKVDSEQKKKENPQNSFSSCPAGSTSSSVDFHLMQWSARPNNRAKREGKGKIAGDSVCSLTPTLRRMRTSVTQSVFPLFFSFSQQKNQGLTRFIFGLTWRDHLLLRTPKHKLADPLVAPLRKRITERRGVLTESPPPSSCAVQDVWGNIWSPPPSGIDTTLSPSGVSPHSWMVQGKCFLFVLFKQNKKKKPLDQISCLFVSCSVSRLFSLNSNYSCTSP